jgi:hypothetical protein
LVARDQQLAPFRELHPHSPIHEEAVNMALRRLSSWVKAGAVALGMLTAIAATAACKKTGEGEYEVQRPTVGVTTDTIRTPDVDVREDTVGVRVPNVDVNQRDRRR